MSNQNISTQILLDQVFIASVDTAIAIFDKDFCLSYINPTAENFFKLKKNQHIGQSIKDIHINSPETTQIFLNAEREIVAGGQFEYLLEQTINNKQRYLGIRLTGLRENKLIVGYLLLATDITLRHKAEIKLKTEEQHFRSLYDKAPSPYHSLDTNGRIKFVNQAWLNTLGYKEEDVLGRVFSDFLVAEQHDIFTRQFSHFKQQGEVHAVVFSMLHALGHKLAMSFEGMIVYNNQGEFSHSHCILLDVSSQHKLQQQLKKSEIRYRSIFLNLAAGLATADESGHFLSANPKFCDFLGYSEAELLKLTFRDITHPDDIPDSSELFNHLAKKQQNEKFAQIEKRYLHKSGKTVWGLLSYSWVNDLDGQPGYAIGLVQDITEQMNARQELEMTYFSLNQAADSVLWLTPQGNIIYVNEVACKSLGYRRDELLNMSLQTINPGFQAEDCEIIWQKIKQNKTVLIESTHRRKDGTEYPVEINTNYFKYGDQEINCCIARDITKRKQEEDNKAQLQREFQQTQKMEALGHLTGGIAHDFNNMLASILGFCNLIQMRYEQLDEKKLKSYLDAIKLAGDHGKELVEQMLRFSRNQPGEQQPVSLPPLIKEVVKMLKSTLPSSIEIQFDSNHKIPTILADPIQIHQALINLCLNARDALSGQGKIKIALTHRQNFGFECTTCHTRSHNNWVELTVSDNGSSIPEEIQHKIFDPFYSTKEVGKGTGIGLTVVNSILHQHQAHLILESHASEGTSFRLFFQIAKNQNICEPKPTFIDHTELPYKQLNARILVVDDDTAVLNVHGEFLKMKGMLPTTVNDSQQALDLFANNPDAFDLILTDQTMPGLTGIEFTKQIHYIRPEIPVILLTGWSDKINSKNSKQLGFEHFLTKPVNLEQLLQDIWGLLNTAH